MNLEVRAYGELISTIKVSKIDITTHGVRVVSNEFLQRTDGLEIISFSEIGNMHHERGYIIRVLDVGVSLRIT